MSSINFATKEISVKIVFYGPGLCGKTTTLQAIYQSIKPEKRPQMVSLATDIDRTIFFDFLPVNAYKVGDFVVRVQLYTVPGQVFYNSTRKLVLNGVDGVVFVVDSQRAALDENRESLQNLADNLRELGMQLGRVPYVFQYNKRDLGEILTIDELNSALNPDGVPAFPAVATNGEGVPEVLKGISRLVITDLTNKGVGRKVLQKETGGWAPPRQEPSPAPSDDEGATSIEAAVKQAAPRPPANPSFPLPATPATAAPTTRPLSVLSFSALWPSTQLRSRCREVESAISKGDYRDAVISAWSLCVATTDEQPGEDSHELRDNGTVNPALEMLLRGVNGPKFLRFRELVHRARGGDSVNLTDALFALHIAVELVL